MARRYILTFVSIGQFAIYTKLSVCITLPQFSILVERVGVHDKIFEYNTFIIIILS